MFRNNRDNKINMINEYFCLFLYKFFTERYIIIIKFYYTELYYTNWYYSQFNEILLKWKLYSTNVHRNGTML